MKVPYRLQSVECDSGIAQSTSVTHDDDATVRQAASFYATFRDRIADEVDQVSQQEVKLIVGDIPPLAFEVAERLGVPSVAIGNFTWDWIYETQPGFEAIDGLLPLIRTAYAKATTALELPFGAGFDVFPAARRIPLVARHATQNRADTRAHFGVPPDRPAVLLSFGGYGLPALDLSSIDCRDSWTIVTTNRITSKTGAMPPHVVFLAEERFLGGTFRYEDLVASSDAVITKPGYGIVAECIASNTPLLYTSRGVFREYDLFVREMPKYLRCRFISQADLFAGRWRESLEALLGQPSAPETIATNGAEVAAREFEALVGRT